MSNVDLNMIRVLRVHAPTRHGVAQTVPAAVNYLQSLYLRVDTFDKVICVAHVSEQTKKV
jgi:hypothetical protein